MRGMPIAHAPAPTGSACSRTSWCCRCSPSAARSRPRPTCTATWSSSTRWLSDAQFTASIAIAQAAPGPNVLFVAVLGWNVAGPLGALATMLGILMPCTTLSLSRPRAGARSGATRRGVRAFTAGLAPLTLGLLLATGWVLAEPFARTAPARWRWWRSSCWRSAASTRLSPIWMVALGALVGALGLA